MEVVTMAILLACVGGFAYFIVGLIPGTDETASIAPVVLILALMNVDPAVLLCFFMAAVAAMETANTIPSVIALIPGSTMAVPFVEPCAQIRRLALPHLALRKMLASSVVGTIVALPIALTAGHALVPLGPWLRANASILFFCGAMVVAILSRARWAAALAIVPFGLFVHAIQQLSTQQAGKSLFIAFFLGIAIGPLLVDLIALLAPEIASGLRTEGQTTIAVARGEDPKAQASNPFRVLGKRQSLLVVGASALTSLVFVLSPVGMTVLAGEVVQRFRGSVLRRLLDKLVVMDAVTNSTYVAETLIPLVAVGLPISPMALGPAAPLFNTPGRFTSSDPMVNLHTLLSFNQIAVFASLGSLIGLGITYSLAITRARSWCVATLRRISIEALIAAFVAIAVVLSYHEGAALGVVAALATALFSGLLSRMYRVDLGVLYMSFYAAPFVVALLR